MLQNRINPHVHIPYEKIGEHIKFISLNKLNLEIYFESSSLDFLTNDSILKLREILDYNPSLSFHAPFMDMSPGAVDSRVRAATMDRFNHILDVAEILRPECIVFHSGYEKWKYALKTDLWLEKSVETWIPLNKRAQEIEVKIAIENIFEDEPENIRLLMEGIGSDNFGVCFDTGHCNLFSTVPLDTWLKSLKPYIIELHLHDNDKSADQHLPVGDGDFDFKTLFAELSKTDYIYTIEARSPEDVMKSMNMIRRYLNG